jgi:hypothetical protein
MLNWEIGIAEEGTVVRTYKLPGTVTNENMIDLLRLLAAKSLTFDEIVGCVWSEHHSRLALLDVRHHDEGQTLTCGPGAITATARQKWEPT